MPDNPFPAFIKHHPAHSWETPDTMPHELDFKIKPQVDMENRFLLTCDGVPSTDWLLLKKDYKWKGTQLMMWHPADHWRIVEIDWERK